MKKEKLIIGLLLFALSAPLASAVFDLDSEAQVNFQTIYDVEIENFSVPTRLKAIVPGLQENGITVVNENDIAQPVVITRNKNLKELNALAFESSQTKESLTNLTDGSYETYTEFDLDNDDGEAFVVLEAKKEIAVNEINLVLDAFVTLPDEIKIEALNNGEWSTVFAREEVFSRTINFPETVAKEWKVTFWHQQPLRIVELKLRDIKKVKSETTEIVWLAKPGSSYQIFVDAEIKTITKTEEVGDLLREPLGIIETSISKKENPTFKHPDTDKDGVANYIDNCATVSNPEQVDADKNGLGDKCEDQDFDGIINAEDNCPEEANRQQRDEDEDGIGDLCDGEESRLTERLFWLPWLAIGIAAAVLGSIFFYTLKDK